MKKKKRIKRVVVDDCGCGCGLSAGFVIAMAFTKTFQNGSNGIRVSTVRVVWDRIAGTFLVQMVALTKKDTKKQNFGIFTLCTM